MNSERNKIYTRPDIKISLAVLLSKYTVVRGFADSIRISSYILVSAHDKREVTTDETDRQGEFVSVCAYVRQKMHTTAMTAHKKRN